MNKPTIVVVGSTNTDMVIKTTRLPQPGETIIGGDFFMNAGGKGANQAVAAQRLGGRVLFMAKTGNDIFGRQAMELFAAEGIDTSCMVTDAIHPSGVALITVDEEGENCIVVASGANATLTINDIQQAEDKIENAAIILVQLEIPLETVEYIAAFSSSKKIRFVLNPAPACKLPDEFLANVSVITPNQKEAEMLTSVNVNDKNSAQRSAKIFHRKGIETVIITMGSQGAFVSEKGENKMIAAPRVKAIDTTAAGDIFNGALVVALSEGKNTMDAVDFACRAASISVTRLGAQACAPYRSECT